MASKFIFLLLIGIFYSINHSAARIGPGRTLKWLDDVKGKLGNECKGLNTQHDAYKYCVLKNSGLVVNDKVDIELILNYLTKFYDLDKSKRKDVEEDLSECRDTKLQNQYSEKLGGILYDCIIIAVLSNRLDMNKINPRNEVQK